MKSNVQINVFLMVIIFCIFYANSLAFTEDFQEKYANIFDFGAISINTSVQHCFVIQNNGIETLRIQNAIPSNAGIQIISFPREILPFDKGELKIRFKPQAPGKLSSEIIVETDNAPNGIRKFLLMGTIEGEGKKQWEDNRENVVPSKLLTRKLRRPNPDLFISPERVIRMNKQKQDMMLVDVRAKEDFDRVRIPDSIHIPIYALKTKRFLKGKKLILVHKGHNWTQLEKETKNLRALGFQAWILEGGLNAWKAEGGALDGDAFAQRDLNRISPDSFFSEKDYKNWIMLDISESITKEGEYLIPDAIPIPFSDDKEAFLSKWNMVVRQYQKVPLLTILIFNEDGEGYDRIENIIQETRVSKVFYLKGGLEGYRQFLFKQNALLEPKIESGRLTPCPNCPQMN